MASSQKLQSREPARAERFWRAISRPSPGTQFRMHGDLQENSARCVANERCKAKEGEMSARMHARMPRILGFHFMGRLTRGLCKITKKKIATGTKIPQLMSTVAPAQTEKVGKAPERRACGHAGMGRSHQESLAAGKASTQTRAADENARINWPSVAEVGEIVMATTTKMPLATDIQVETRMAYDSMNKYALRQHMVRALARVLPRIADSMDRETVLAVLQQELEIKAATEAIQVAKTQQELVLGKYSPRPGQGG